jgi:hypothetical protein
MKVFLKKLITAILIPVLVGIILSTPAIAEDDKEIPRDIDAHTMAWDAFLVRPLGVVSIAVGSAVFVISWPLAALGGNGDMAFEKLVAGPVKFTFQRGLGDF